MRMFHAVLFFRRAAMTMPTCLCHTLFAARRWRAMAAEVLRVKMARHGHVKMPILMPMPPCQRRYAQIRYAYSGDTYKDVRYVDIAAYYACRYATPSGRCDASQGAKATRDARRYVSASQYATPTSSQMLDEEKRRHGHRRFCATTRTGVAGVLSALRASGHTPIFRASLPPGALRLHMPHNECCSPCPRRLRVTPRLRCRCAAVYAATPPI